MKPVPHRPSTAAASGAVRTRTVRVSGADYELMIELASDTQTLVPTSCIRICVDDLERAFGSSEVQVAVMAAPDLRYLYVNPPYHAIRPEVAMVGRTYREVFPQAAEAGAEERLQSVIDTSETWIVEDYPTWLPNRAVPAWWQGECLPIDLHDSGRPDAALVLLWDVTQRHIPDWSAPVKSATRVRIESAKARLTARMATYGLEVSQGWHISEEIRETEEATQWILRPMHLRHVAPAFLVERVEFPRFAGQA